MILRNLTEKMMEITLRGGVQVSLPPGQSCTGDLDPGLPRPSGLEVHYDLTEVMEQTSPTSGLRRLND